MALDASTLSAWRVVLSKQQAHTERELRRLRFLEQWHAIEIAQLQREQHQTKG